jgi:proteasome assembly chaperone (PAC2) family protein
MADAPDELRWEPETPPLRRPVLVAAFEGWNDAGDAASMAVQHLLSLVDDRLLASIDPESFYDFTSTRPEVRLVGGAIRRIQWPSNDVRMGTLPGADRDLVLLAGVEPHLRWRTFCGHVVEIARRLRCELVITLGALLADVPHSVPVRVTGTASDSTVAGRLGLERSRYEGPTGIVGVLHDALAKARVESVSIWAAVPHYLQGTPSPKAALALLERVASMLTVPVPLSALEVATAEYERQVDDAISGDDEMQAFVRQLEAAQGDDDDDEDDPDLAPEPGRLTDSEGNVPSGDAIAAEFERFLREQG